MKEQRAIVPIASAAALGFVLWLATSLLSGRREAWDSSLYWLFAYPVSLLTCAYLGYSHPQRPWLWAIVLFEAQLLAMCLRNGELGNLFPLGVILFGVLAVPGILVANFAARRSAKSSNEST